MATTETRSRRTHPRRRLPSRLSACIAACLLPAAAPSAAQDGIVAVGGEGRHCGEDPACINRLHPAIPMAARAQPGQTLVFRVRNASDFDLDPESTYDDPRQKDPQIGTVHPLTGPVHIEGAEPAHVLAVTLLDIAPGRFAYTSVSPIRFVSDHVTGSFRAEWRLDRTEAASDDVPGFPLKAAGEVPPDMCFLGASDRIAGLRNMSKDVSLAARNALLAMVDYMTATYRLTPEQAYVVASVAVDLPIGQLVDVPNVGLTALLPLDIFTHR